MHDDSSYPHADTVQTNADDSILTNVDDSIALSEYRHCMS